MDNNLTVLYEDNQIIVVVKPQNVPTQAESSGDKDLLTMIKEYVKEKYDKPGEVYIGLVHRLDRPTGGVMVFARTSKAAARLQEQMKTGLFEKKYLAVTVGVPRDRQGRLSQYLVKDEKNNMVRVVPAAVEGAKKAELEYKVLEIAGSVALVGVLILAGLAVYFFKTFRSYVKAAVALFVVYALVAGIVMLVLEIIKHYDPAYLEENDVYADIVPYVFIPTLVTVVLALVSAINNMFA